MCASVSAFRGAAGLSRASERLIDFPRLSFRSGPTCAPPVEDGRGKVCTASPDRRVLQPICSSPGQGHGTATMAGFVRYAR